MLQRQSHKEEYTLQAAINMSEYDSDDTAVGSDFPEALDHVRESQEPAQEKSLEDGEIAPAVTLPIQGEWDTR